MLSAWIRVIRVRFLLASVIAVSAGLAVSWWHGIPIDVTAAALTVAGVVALHASVDLLNDYWDFKRGIDTRTKRTPMSGGTGVLPEGLLKPEHVYRAGMAALAVGTAIGGYFVITTGVVIAVILGFAIISIYFYSTRIVDSGLAEIFVAIKGAMIVLGTSYIQSPTLTMDLAVTGVIIGTLSSLVLFVTSFPDHDADKAGGRRTLVVTVGSKGASRLFWCFPLVVYGMLAISVLTGVFPVYSLAMLAAAPFCAVAGIYLARHHDEADCLLPAMLQTLRFSRIGGALLVLGFLVAPF